MRRLFPILAFAALAACSERPTAVEPTVGPEFLNVSNLEGRGYTLQWAVTIPEVERWPGAFFPCINGGQGEYTEVWGGPYEYWAKVVQTPSGRRLENGYIFLSPEGTEYDRGVVTGDVWTVTGLGWLSKLGYSYAPDGSNWITQPFSAMYTKQGSSDQIWMNGMVHFQTDANGIVVRNARLLGEIQQCRVLK